MYESELPGVKKKSFQMFFCGGAIWIEHLDGIYGYTDLAVKKFSEDYLQFKRPSMPSLIAINIDETIVNERLAAALAEKLLSPQKRIAKVVFTGAGRGERHRIKRALSGAGFLLAFINDFEKAKEWLINKPQ